MTDFQTARVNMVECQVRPNDVTDVRLQEALRTTPRELFVPKSKRSIAYMEQDIDLGAGRYLLEARDFSKLVNALAIKPEDVALDIGCATGYSTAILGRLCETVVAVESDETLAAQATGVLTDLSIDNAVVVAGPLANGAPKQAPFDVIFVNAAIAEAPQALLEQLAPGGRLGAIIRDGAVGKACVFVKGAAGEVGRRDVFDAMAPLLPGFEKQRGFVF